MGSRVQAKGLEVGTENEIPGFRMAVIVLTCHFPRGTDASYSMGRVRPQKLKAILTLLLSVGQTSWGVNRCLVTQHLDP